MAEELHRFDHLELVEKELDSLKQDIETLFNSRNDSATFRGQAKIAFVILMASYGIGLLYTHDHIKDAQAVCVLAEAERDSAAKERAELRGRVMLQDDRYIRIIKDIGNLVYKVDELNNTVVEALLKEKSK